MAVKMNKGIFSKKEILDQSDHLHRPKESRIRTLSKRRKHVSMISLPGDSILWRFLVDLGVFLETMV